MPAVPSDPRATPPRRWLMPALLVSVALNLAVAGGVAGAYLGGSRAPAERTAAGGPAWLEALSPSDRAALRSAWRADGADPHQMRADRHQRAAELALLLRSDPFDADAVADALRHDAGLRAEREAEARRMLVAHLAALPAADRLAFADRLEAAAHSRRPPRDGRGRPGGRQGAGAPADDATDG
ncbi:MAG: periplasmic heavy metal sensor [Alkalilacustris sp.]